MDFDELGLRELPEPPAKARDEVRSRVLGRIRTRRRIRKALVAASALAAGLLMVAAALIALRSPRPVPAPPMLASAPAAPSIPLRGPERSRRQAHRSPKPAAPPLMVRLETDDPNVVILWMAN